jgi:pimeloyl-ACP methyl ester carboxylesterase
MNRICIFGLASLLLAACVSTPHLTPESNLPSPQVTIVTSAPPTLTPSPTATPTLDEWIFPYTIRGLREHDYQSGEVKVGDVVEETDLFTRYAIEYPSDGLTITGVMQVPKTGEEPFPVIVMNHGFFSRSIYASGDGTDRAAEFLNRWGYLTISSDYRSWGGSDVGYSLFYSGLVIDVINLLNAIPSIPQADPKRVGMWGHSMGGGVTLKVLAITGDQGTLNGHMKSTPEIRAAVLYSTVSADDADIIDRWGPGCIGDALEGERLYGCNSSDILPLDLPPGLIQAYKDATRNPDQLRRVAALRYLDDVSAPVQINYGTEDGKVFSGTPPEWSQKAYKGFIDASKQAELFAYEGEGHSFIGDQWYAFMERSAHFFDEYVK